MSKTMKRIELRRETVRTLAMKTGLRTGDAAPEIVTQSKYCHDETGTAPGMTGTNLKVSGESGIKIDPPVFGPPKKIGFLE